MRRARVRSKVGKMTRMPQRRRVWAQWVLGQKINSEGGFLENPMKSASSSPFDRFVGVASVSKLLAPQFELELVVPNENSPVALR